MFVHAAWMQLPPRRNLVGNVGARIIGNAAVRLMTWPKEAVPVLALSREWLFLVMLLTSSASEWKFCVRFVLDVLAFENTLQVRIRNQSRRQLQ